MALFVEISLIQCFVVVFGLFTSVDGKAGRYNDDNDDDDDDDDTVLGCIIIMMMAMVWLSSL